MPQATGLQNLFLAVDPKVAHDLISAPSAIYWEPLQTSHCVVIVSPSVDPESVLQLGFRSPQHQSGSSPPRNP